MIGSSLTVGPTGDGGVLLAHGVGDRQDLPIPFSYALTGAAIAVGVSFVAMGLLWRSSRDRKSVV